MNTGLPIYKGSRGGKYIIVNGRKSYKFKPQSLVNRSPASQPNNNPNNIVGNYYIVNRTKLFNKNGFEMSRNSNYLRTYVGQQKVSIKKTNKYPNRIRDVVPSPKNVTRLRVLINSNAKNQGAINNIYKRVFNNKPLNDPLNFRNYYLVANRGNLIMDKYGKRVTVANLRNKLNLFNHKVVPANPTRYEFLKNRGFNSVTQLNKVIFTKLRTNKTLTSDNTLKTILNNNKNVQFNYNNNNSKCEFILKKQLRGTCWAHALINSWLMSNIGRKMLQKKLNEFQENHGMLEYNNGVCPMKGKITGAYFWSYIDHILNLMENSSLPRYNEKFNQNNVFSNSLRMYNGMNKASAMEGGSIEEFFKMNYMIYKPSEIVNQSYEDRYNWLKVTDKTKMISLKVSFLEYQLPQKIKVKNKTFVLVNSYIAIVIPGQTTHGYHAVAGAICNNTPIAIDSNNPTPQKLNWTDGSKMEAELQKLSNTYNTSKAAKEMLNKQKINRAEYEKTEQGREILKQINKLITKPVLKFNYLYANYIRDC